MKKEKRVEGNCLLIEVLNMMVCEKSDLVWYIPFSVELHQNIVKELAAAIPVSSN